MPIPPLWRKLSAQGRWVGRDEASHPRARELLVTCSCRLLGRRWPDVTVVGTGGTGLRSQIRCTPTSSVAPFPSQNTSDPSCPIWASIYTTNQGANYGVQFISFNVDGNPKKARGYFKNIAGATIDNFTILAD